MDEQNQDGSEVLETTETEGEQGENAEPTAEELKAQLEAEKAAREEAEKKNKQLFERAKKAEEGRKESSDLSAKDLLALSKADIHPDDIEELQEFASFKKISIADALNNPTMKALLADHQAERKTANATQTKGARGANKPDGEQILRKAITTGEVPDDEEGLQELWRARMAHKGIGVRK